MPTLASFVVFECQISEYILINDFLSRRRSSFWEFLKTFEDKRMDKDTSASAKIKFLETKINKILGDHRGTG